MNKKKTTVIAWVLFAIILLSGMSGCSYANTKTEVSRETTYQNITETTENESDLIIDSDEKDKATQITSEIKDIFSDNIPEYNGKAYAVINNNNPSFTSAEKKMRNSFEQYSSLDSLKRCGVAFALIGKDIMPTGERGEIGQVKPSGWKTARYDFVDGKYLYNRCHLIGWQLTGENANEKNLITGTRYMNVDGMLPFENMVDDYIEETGNHVLYRVTPVFKGNELVARGVQIEAYSVEDNGNGICFNVYCFNVQPGVKIDYKTGFSALEGEEMESDNNTLYILNTRSDNFHKPDCSAVKKMSEANKRESRESRDTLISRGYTPCGNCNP